MPVHDWSRVDAGIFHDFHHAWIEEIKRSLNSGLLPDEYYALAEQYAGGFGPDVLTLQERGSEEAERDLAAAPSGSGSMLLLEAPSVAVTGESDMEFYRRKQNSVVVRHVSGDRVVAVVEVMSPGNKSTRSAMRAYVEKAGELLDQRIHLLVLDLHAPTPRDPQGVHGLIWEEISGQAYAAPAKPLTLAAYESALTVRAYVQPVGVGEPLSDMPLFVEPGAHVPVSLEKTYQSAFAALPRRWRVVLDG